MSSPITIGITAYREGEWLRDSWNSVLTQTCQDWEAIIVLDGGADEKTELVFDEISHPRLTKIKCSENIGPYPARELIFDRSRHDIILHTDADDYFLPNAAEVTTRLFHDENVRWIGLGGHLIYEDGRVEDWPGRETDIARLLMEYRFPGYLLFRRSVWRELGGYDPELKRGHADIDICLKILKHGMRGQVTTELCHVKREHGSSVSHVSEYSARLYQFHERIVDNNPDVFTDLNLRTRFLANGYRTSSWALMRMDRLEEAGRVARKHVDLSGARAVWPINWSGRLPRSIIRALLATRLTGGQLARRALLRHRASSPA